MSRGKLIALGMAIAMGLASGSAMAAGDAAKGAKVFKKRCKVCHAVTTKPSKKPGPHLASIIGRKAGSLEFKRYKGLKGSDIVWDTENLDKWLANPRKFVGKKTTMVMKLKKASQRADVIAYLETLK
jgi:cytochrome c